MRYIKRISAVTLIVTFLISLCVVPAANASDTYTQNDMKRFEENTMLLTGLGIMESGRKAATTITRSDFAAIILRFLGYNDDSFTASDKVFTDVPDKTNPIYGMYQLGYMIGHDDGSFRPNDNVTFAQAVKVIVKALKCDFLAETYGGYPNGYVDCARQINLTKDISVANDAPITYFMLSQLVVNALTADGIMKKNGDGDYEVSDTSWLKSQFDTEKYKGIVTAAQNISITENGVEKEGTVTIDKTVYTVDFDCSKFIGCSVEFYANSDDKVICITEKNTNKAEFADSDISGYSGKVYTVYTGENKEKKYTLAQDCYIIYNGSPAEHLTEEDMCPEYGKITLINNGNDSSYDVVVIDSYDIYCTSYIDAENKKIYYKNSNGSILDFSKIADEDITVKNAEGVAAGFDDIPSDSVIRVKINESGSKAEIIYSTRTVRGKITSVSKNGSDSEIYIDGVKYKLFKKLENSSDLYIGKSGVFSLDSEGLVCNISDGDAAYNYGYILTAYEDETYNATMMRIFDSNGKAVIYPLAKKVKTDGVSGKKPEEVVKLLNKNGSIRQIIRYKFNAKNEISEIDTSYNSASDMTALPKNQEDENSLRVIYSGTTRYLSQMHNFAGKFNAGADTLIFVIPGDDLKDYRVKHVSEIPNDTEFTMQAYSDDESQFYAKVIFTEDKNIKGGGGDETIGVIADAVDTLDDEQEPAKGISFRSKYLSQDFLMEEDLANPYPYDTSQNPQYEVETGDIVAIKYSENTANEVAMIYDYSENFFPAGSAYQFIRAHYHYIYGTVYSVEKGYVNVTWKDITKDGSPTIDEIETFSLADFVSMYKVSPGRNGKTTVERATGGDIIDYKTAGDNCSKVFISQEWEYPNLLVIYEQ